jgi:cob(I)alamin adenosyltransferase
LRSLKEAIEAYPGLDTLDKPVVLLLTGEGKGKTTAGIGQLVRAAGRGYRCALVHFLKGVEVGEDLALKKLGVDIYFSGPDHFIDLKNPGDGEVKAIRDFWDKLKGKLKDYDVVMLDEFNLAVWAGIMKPSDIAPLIKDTPPYLWLLIGRRAPDELVELASVASRVDLIKHHYPEVEAMRGLEA